MTPSRRNNSSSFANRENTRRIEELDRKLSDLGIKIKDEDSRKVTDEVFDEVTLLSLYKLVHKKVISSLGGSISSGKEANVFLAGRVEGAECEESESEAPASESQTFDVSQPSKAPVFVDAAVKIYRIRTGNFTRMSEYIVGDPRFSSIRHTHKDMIFAWTKKEFSNLSRAREAGLTVPQPYAFDRNILVMEFMGENGIAYPQMRQILPASPEETYNEALGIITDLYRKAKLVHGDLSEYNILTGPDGLILIDMAQAVTLEHPRAYNFLFRDIANINRFFEKKCAVRDPHEIFREIVGEEFFEL
ncbi:MAG TPA: serine protein kinase RIO [Methanocorpusculum sp.]|nr:serine protein kinase RIO [Methanocorpusculum sp.]